LGNFNDAEHMTSMTIQHWKHGSRRCGRVTQPPKERTQDGNQSQQWDRHPIGMEIS
jgi:hypothetical protein